MRLKGIQYTSAEKYSVFFGIFLTSGNDQYGRRLLLSEDTAEIFGFTFDMQMRYLVYMRYLWKERKGYLAFMSKRRRVSPIKKHERERRTALTHYLGQITEKQMV